MTHYRVNAFLWLSKDSEREIGEFLIGKGVPKSAIQRGMHLTLYHGRRPLSGLKVGSSTASIQADLGETRFMVLAPGGENPRPELEPQLRSIGIRLTRRNKCIPQILDLRRSIYALETVEAVRGRKRTTDWVNAFGARHFQPHVKLMWPGNRLDRHLSNIGELLRAAIKTIEFDQFEIKVSVHHKLKVRLPLTRPR